ncbi:MAG: DsbA family protein, partial [Pseudomonadota bacterium]
MQFLYVMDPMCGWCYGFQPQLEAFLAQWSKSEVTWVMGGLAPDNDQPMDDALRETIAAYWHQIEKTAGVPFNHDYWRINTPYRSTYPACRAVVAAETLTKGSSCAMAKAIQAAYYRDAKNPSLEDTLVACADSIGFSSEEFREELRSDETERTFQDHLGIVGQLQV